MMLLRPNIFFSSLIIFSVLILSASCFITVNGSIANTDDQSEGITSAQIDPLTGTIGNFLTYDNADLGIQLQYPLDWKRSETENSVRFDVPPQSSSDIHPEYISIFVESWSGRNLDELANVAINDYKRSLNDFKVVKSDPLTTTGGQDIPSHALLYSFADPVLGPARVIEVGMIADEKLYIAKYIATPETYSTYFPTFLKMIDSLKILTSDLDNENARSVLSNSTTNFVMYENHNYGWKIRYPSDWRVEEQAKQGSNNNRVNFIAPFESSTDEHRETLVASSYPSVTMQLDELVNQTLDFYRETLTDLEIIDSNQTDMINGTPGQMFVYTYSDPSMGVTKAIDIGTIKDNKVYVIQFFAKPTTYSYYLPIVQEMIDSFELLNNNASLVSNTNLTLEQRAIGERIHFLTYEDTDFGFAIEYPDDWKKEIYEHGAGFTSPKKGFYDKYAESLDILVFRVGSREVPFFRSVNTPLLEVVREELRYRQDAYNDFQLLSSNSTTLVNGTVPAEMLSFIYSDQEIGQTKVTAIIAVKGENIYIIEYGAKHDEFSDSLPVAQQMIGSFSILDDVINGAISTDVIAPGFLIYENPTYSVKLQHPSSWTIKENAPPNAIVDFISPPEDDSDGYFESIELYVYPPGSISYFPTADTPLDDKFIQGEINFLNETFAGFELLDSRTILLKGSNNNNSSSNILAYMIEFTQMDPEDGLTRSLQVVSKIGSNVYVLLHGAMPDKYSQYLPTIQKMIDSFRVMESTTAPLSNFFTYENPTVGIRMQYPGDWEDQYSAPYFQGPGQELGHSVEFISPQTALAGSGISAKDVAEFEIASILSPSVGGIDDKSDVLHNAVNAILDNRAQNLDGFVFIESTPTTLLGNNNPTHKIVYTYLDSDLGKIKEMELVTLDGDRIYVITYGATVTTYDFFLPTVQRMLDSMEILSSNPTTSGSDSAITDNNKDQRDEPTITFGPVKRQVI